MATTIELDSLTARLRASARDGGLIETAQVRLLGLDDVRAAAGARWPRMREHVREGSIKIISERLGPDDSVIPCGDGFLVVFADGPPDDLERRCADVRDALIRFYLGEEALRTLRAKVQRETTTASGLAGLVAQAPKAANTAAPKTELKLGRFWPIWSTRHQAVAAHLCAPIIHAGAGHRIGYAPDFLDTASHRERDFLDLDLCLLEQACAAAARPDTAPIGVTVHATTLQSRKSRKIYLEHVAGNAPPVQQRMFVAIAEIEPGAPLISLTEWTKALKQTFPRVSLDLHRNDRALKGLGTTGAWAAGYHLPPMGREAGMPFKAALTELDTWCRTLRRQGVQPFINGFAHSAFLDLAAYSELTFATGEALWPSREAPPELERATRKPQLVVHAGGQP